MEELQLILSMVSETSGTAKDMLLWYFAYKTVENIFVFCFIGYLIKKGLEFFKAMTADR
jgi:hypothetical protein